MHPVDPYLISSQMRPLLEDGSLSQELRAAVYNSDVSIDLKLSTNAAGKTPASREKTLRSLAAGNAKLVARYNDPKWIRDNHGERAQEEVEDTLHALRDAFQLAQLPGARPAFSMDSSDNHSGGAICALCEMLIVKRGHESQKHICFGDGAFVKVQPSQLSQYHPLYLPP